MGTSGFPENTLWKEMKMGSTPLTDLFFIRQIVSIFFPFTMGIDTKHRHKRSKLMLINLLFIDEEIREL